MKELQHLAIDPLDQMFTWPAFQYLSAQRAAKMEPLLMDQKFISGLGNIYSDEVLFHAGCGSTHERHVESQEVRRLTRAIQEILQEAIKLRGTALEDEPRSLFGKPGEYGSELKVYGRAGMPTRPRPSKPSRSGQRKTRWTPPVPELKLALQIRQRVQRMFGARATQRGSARSPSPGRPVDLAGPAPVHAAR